MAAFIPLGVANGEPLRDPAREALLVSLRMTEEEGMEEEGGMKEEARRPSAITWMRQALRPTEALRPVVDEGSTAAHTWWMGEAQ